MHASVPLRIFSSGKNQIVLSLRTLYTGLYYPCGISWLLILRIFWELYCDSLIRIHLNEICKKKFPLNPHRCVSAKNSPRLKSGTYPVSELATKLYANSQTLCCTIALMILYWVGLKLLWYLNPEIYSCRLPRSHLGHPAFSTHFNRSQLKKNYSGGGSCTFPSYSHAFSPCYLV